MLREVLVQEDAGTVCRTIILHGLGKLGYGDLYPPYI